MATGESHRLGSFEIENFKVFQVGYRNAITIWAFEIAALTALSDSNCALVPSYKIAI
jgi:hypothetical protein